MSSRAALPSKKPAITLFILLAGVLVPYVVTPLSRFTLVRPADLGRCLAPRAQLLVWTPEELSIPAPRVRRAYARPSLPLEPAPLPAPRRRPGSPPPAEPGTAIEAIEALASFYARLDLTRRGLPGALTRITHFGDSPLTGDLISGEARARFQERFGDGGHGFLLIGRPWGWYGHLGVTLRDSGWRKLSPLFGNGNGRHGLSGVSFTSASAKASARIETEAPFEKLEVFYALRPGGGRFLVEVDDSPPQEVSTAAEKKGAGVFVLKVGDEAHEVSIHPKGDAEVALYGAVLERRGPGVVYDALGANGASVHFLTLLDAEGWEEALAQRKSDLVILNYGTNESGYWGIPGPRYEKEYAEVIARVRRALPNASILLMAPMDRGMRDESGAIVTVPKIPEIVEAQRRVARENGCAFFDTFAAMGGSGTMARWYESEPRLVSGDFTHTTRAGSDRVARLLVSALEAGYLEASRPAARAEQVAGPGRE